MAGKGSAETRGRLAGGESGSIDSGFRPGGQGVDVSRFVKDAVDSAANAVAGDEGSYQEEYYDDSAERAAAAEAERQRQIELENERKRKEKDKRIREEEQSKKQQQNISPSNLKPVEGYEHILQDENGARYPKGGQWTDEAIDDVARAYDQWLYDTAGFADISANELEEERKKDQEYYDELLQKQAQEVTASHSSKTTRRDTEQQTGQTRKQNKQSQQQEENKELPKKGTPVRKANIDTDGDELPEKGKVVFPRNTDDGERSQAEAAESNQATNTEPAEPTPEEPTSEEARKITDRFFNDTSSERIKAGLRAMELEKEDWLRNHPGMTEEDYKLSDQYWYDAEAFTRTLKSMISEQTMRLGQIKYDEEGNLIDPGLDQKENPSQANLIQSVVEAFKIGFFHITSEHVDTDSKTGEQTIGWSGRVETRIIRLCDYLGMDPDNLDSQRTVFRLVTLYASMGVDRHGKMFNEGKDEWSLTDDEFCAICDMIYISCVEYGHPLMPPWKTSVGEQALRGTDIIPAGVLPVVVARAIAGPDSKLRVNGVKPSASDLIEMARTQWVGSTYPWIKENLINEPQRGKPKLDKDGNPIRQRNRMAQRIAIEDMNQALARIDGKDPETFSDQYGVDTTPHYKIEEYRNTHKVYAQAMDDMFDAKKVSEFQDELYAAVLKDSNSQKSKEIGVFGAAANIVTSGIRTNALFWNVPIALSAIAEKGVGDLQTDFAIKSISAVTAATTNQSKMDVSQELKDALKTDEAYKSLESALIIMDIAGPQGLMLFAKKNPGEELNPETAAEFLNKYYLPKAKNAGAAKAMEFQKKLSKFQQTLLTGDIAFKDYDAKNFLNAFLTCNQVLLGAQDKLLAEGIMDEHAGLALTGEEIDDIFMAHNGNIASFIAEAMSLAAGRDAMIMMRSNNIGNFNPVGYAIGKFFKNHGVSEALVTSILDSFPKYGINFLYAITPFSRSLSYMEMKRREAGGDALAGMFVMGGGLADVSNVETFKQAMSDPAFKAGLRMNLMYDAMTIGRWSVTAIILGGVMAALGFEPPDDPEKWQNVSRWKIGGQEIQAAYWINDLAQLGLPLAYGFAAVLSGHGDKAATLVMNSIYDQIDGNVIVDFAKYVKGWNQELEKLDMMAYDPTYISGFDLSYGIMELMLSATDKIVPGAPLYRYIQDDSFLLGDEAGKKTPNRKFDKSTDWAKQVGKTDYVDDPHERQIRKHCTANWLLAGYLDFTNGILFNPNSDKTGYFWWEMPDKTKQDDLVLTWMDQQKMDYTNREGCLTDEAYKELKTDQLLTQINSVIEEYGGLEQAVMHGYVIRHDVRYAALEVLCNRAAAEEHEFQRKVDSGELVKYTPEFYSEKDAKTERVNKLWDYIHILQNDDIPVWYEGYRQILSDKEIDYYHEDGTSASPLEYFFPVFGPVRAEYSNKGNHPWAVAPFTFVDKTSNDNIKRDPVTGESLPFWYQEGEDGGTSLQAIMNGIGQKTIPMGRNAGKVLNDVLFGGTLNEGEYLHPDIATVGDRAWEPIKGYLSDDIANFDAANRIKELTAKLNTPSDNDTSGGGSGNRGFTSSYFSSGSYSGSNGYNPKIYSNPRQLNAPKAATMYTKQLRDAKANYLNPSFSTKGSREAYKRQDI